MPKDNYKLRFYAHKQYAFFTAGLYFFSFLTELFFIYSRIESYHIIYDKSVPEIEEGYIPKGDTT